MTGTFDDWQKRAAVSLHNRHREAARKRAESIIEYAGYILRDLDAEPFRVPHYSLVDDAVELSRRLAMLEALGDLTAVYEAVESVPVEGE